MGGFSTHSFFRGELDGHTSRDFSKLDYSITKFNDRVNHIENILNGSYFFVDYFDNIFKVNVNASDPLSEDINVCNILERMANYILNSDEVKEEDEKNKPVYVFHKNKENLDNKIKKESISVTGINGSNNIVDEENIIHALIAQDKNSRAPKVQTITKADLKEESFLGDVLRDYQQFLDFIDERLQEKPDSKWRYYSNAKYSVKDDMINAKNMIKGVWGYNIKISESHKPDMDIFNFADYDTVKYLLTMSKPSLSFDYDNWIIWTDFQNLLKKIHFTTEEEAVICCLRDQWTLVEISEEMNLEYQRLQRTVIPNIIKKIVKEKDLYDAEDYKTRLKLFNRKYNKKKGKQDEI